MEQLLYRLSDAAGALALLAFVTIGGYLLVRYARRNFPTAAERRLLDQQDAILDALVSLEERLRAVETDQGSVSLPTPQKHSPQIELPERVPTPV